MITEQLDANQPPDLARAAQLLIEGQCVAVPTETVYGLAADAANPEAVRKIFAAKGRPANHPLIVHLAGVEDIPKWAVEIPAEALQLAAHFWPGPLSLLLKKAPWVDGIVTGEQDTIVLRSPAHPVMQKLLQMTKLGLAAPSANPYQQLSPTRAAHVSKGLSGRIEAILDGGDCTLGLESTIVDLTCTPPQILRPGPISADQLSAQLGLAVGQPERHEVAVSGNCKQHYQPRTPLYLAERDYLQRQLANQSAPLGLVFYSQGLIDTLVLGKHGEQGLHWRQLSDQKAGYSQQLYSSLHELDELALSAIWLELPPQTPDWQDVNDRLGRAATS